jgi:regulatory protein
MELAEIERMLLRRLERREHSQDELRKILVKAAVPNDVANELLARLVSRNLQSDERFAEALFRQKLRAGYGPVFINAALAQRGISKSLIKQVLEREQPNWSALAEDLWHKRSGRIQARGDALRLARQLANRGFTAESIQPLLNRYGRGQEDGVE